MLAYQESLWSGRLEQLTLWVRFGPALGLMGTLIPLGPALVGLAQGDLETMATNLIIAFATTVVGLLISLIALALQAVRKCWYRNDSIFLSFVAERLVQMANRPASEIKS